MKKLLLLVMVLLIVAMALSSCSETTSCPSYGGIKRMTSHGHKAQARYAKHVRKAI